MGYQGLNINTPVGTVITRAARALNGVVIAQSNRPEMVCVPICYARNQDH